MKLMATAKKTVVKSVKKVARAVEKALEPVVKGSDEWKAMKLEARKRLDNL